MVQHDMVAAGHSKRPQKLGEEISNAISHGIGALLAITGTVLLIIRATTHGDSLAVTSVSLYGASMIILYTISCLYHALTAPHGKKVFQILDHCSIFLLILGSYIPISLVCIGGFVGWTLFGINTACAILGITLNSINMVRWQRFSLVLYAVMGWLVVFTIRPLLHAMPIPGLILLVLGGVAYTVGIYFYKQKQRLYMHFIWHLFVLTGSVLHYFLIYQYCCFAV